jgi:predicted RNA binding protein YcfA (HicA-like mRNA interferase family)
LGKLRVLSGAQVCQILEYHGFRQVRQRGSHRVMQKRLDTGTITVPVPMHATVRRGTLLSVIRQSGTSKTRFEIE